MCFKHAKSSDMLPKATEVIDLYKYFNQARKTRKQRGFLHIYAHSSKRPAFLIIPGGAYSIVSHTEWEPVVARFDELGFNCFVLNYSVAPSKYPTQLIEGAMAMAYLRQNHERLNVISDKITVCGFSAGGHLAGCLCAFANSEIVKNILPQDNCLPNSAVLCYPVISSDPAIWHKYSFNVICGTDSSLAQALSLEKCANDLTPPTFIWHTKGDSCVPVANSIAMADALAERNILHHLRLFETGEHGLSIAMKKYSTNDNKEVAVWSQECSDWLKNNNLA